MFEKSDSYNKYLCNHVLSLLSIKSELKLMYGIIFNVSMRKVRID